MKRMLAVVSLATLVAGSTVAGAAASPSVSLSLPSTANAASAIPFSYTTKGISAGDQVVFQRQQGTARVWRTVLRLRHSGTGSATLPALSLGRYQTRIAVIGPRKRVVAQQTRSLAVFGDVPFSTLFGSSDRGLGGGVYTTSTGTFPYVLGFYNGHVNFTAFTVTSNPCRLVHLMWVTAPPSPSGDLSKQQGSTTIVQQSADPVSVTLPGASIGTLSAPVVPGQSWALNLGQSEGYLFTWYVNGSASCFSSVLRAQQPPG